MLRQLYEAKEQDSVGIGMRWIGSSRIESDRIEFESRCTPMDVWIQVSARTEDAGADVSGNWFRESRRFVVSGNQERKTNSSLKPDEAIIQH